MDYTQPPAVVRDVAGRRVATVSRAPDRKTQIVRDTKGRRIATIETKPDGSTVIRAPNGKRLGTSSLGGRW